MISRYIVLSGIQLSQTSILVEIQKLAIYLFENLPETKSENVPENKEIISGPEIPYFSIGTCFKIREYWKITKFLVKVPFIRKSVAFRCVGLRKFAFRSFDIFKLERV